MPSQTDILRGVSTFKSHTLFDRYINVQWYHSAIIDPTTKLVTRDEYTIAELDTMNSGYKPDIAVQMAQLPGGNLVLGLTVTIKNLNLPNNLRLQDICKMVVEMGYYSSSNKQQYESIVFRSYQSTPDPDGETVFEGVIVGTALRRIWEQEVHVNIWKEDSTVKEVVEKFCESFGNITVALAESGTDSAFQKWYNTPVSGYDWDADPEKHKEHAIEAHWTAQNALAAFTWLVNWLKESAQAAGITIYGQITDKGFMIGSVQNNGALGGIILDDIPMIDMVYSISFDAVMLNVSCPWIPQVRTGSLICVHPTFFAQSALPNDVDPEVYKSINNLYRVLLVDVTFSTTGQNVMNIKALPWQYSESDTDTQKITEDLKNQLQSKQSVSLVPIVIDIGEPGAIPPDMDTSGGSGETEGSITVKTDTRTSPWMTFSEMAQTVFATLPDASTSLWAALKQEGIPPIFKGRINALRPNHLWPIIVAMSERSSSVCTPIDKKHPTTIPEASTYSYKYPALTDWKQVKTYVPDIMMVWDWCKQAAPNDKNAQEALDTWTSPWQTLKEITDNGWWS